MKASLLLREARQGAGLSQRQLAKLTGLPQASVSRIERGVVSPAVDTLDRLLAACGLEVGTVRRLGQGEDRTLIWERLRMTPTERVSRAENEWRGITALVRAARRARAMKTSTPRDSSRSPTN